jgi:hypothetical protein
MKAIWDQVMTKCSLSSPRVHHHGFAIISANNKKSKKIHQQISGLSVVDYPNNYF